MTETTEFKHFDFETKELSETGKFEGFAAVYGNIDLVQDVIERGAFRKSITERNLRVPVLHEHKVAVGAATLEDSDFGLKALGELNLEKQSARDAYSDLKFYRDRGVKTGMSIGYRPVGDPPQFKNGIRYLRELKLFEVTLTLAPINEKAVINEVKSSTFESQLLAWEDIQAELKSGRKISKERADRLRVAAKEILSLLSEAGADEATTSEGADGKSGGPVIDHAKLAQSIKDLKGVLVWN